MKLHMEYTEKKRNKVIPNFCMIMYYAIFGCSYFVASIYGKMDITVISSLLAIAVGSGYIAFSPLLLRRFNSKSRVVHLMINGFLGTSILVLINAFNVINKDKLVFIFLIMFGILIVAFTIFSIFVINRSLRKRRRKAKTFRFIQRLITILSLAGIVLFFPTNNALENIERFNAASNENIILSTVKANNNAKAKDNSFIKAHLNELMPLVDGTYNNLSTQEKLDILQIVCNIESTYSGNSKGISIALKSLFANDEVCTQGCFSNFEERIYLNLDVFDDMSESEALYVTLHECFHANQYEQIKLLNALSDEFKDNALLHEAKLYEQGFNNYKSCENGSCFEEYESQYVERTANSYAYVTSQEYIKLIKQYSSEKCYK